MTYEFVYTTVAQSKS